MKQLATFVSENIHIKDLFSKGREAHIKGDMKLASKYRDKVHNHLKDSWQVMQEKYHIRQLHFHMGPGDMSFLRLHKPEKFGDDLSSIRHTIVDSILNNIETSGFETGRLYAGVRGVVPISSKGNVIGAVEAGTSYKYFLENLKKETGIDYAVLIDTKLMKDSLWKKSIERKLVEKSSLFGNYIEATTSDDIISLLSNVSNFEQQIRHSEIIKLDTGKVISITFDNLQDYKSQRDGTLGVGHYTTWRDITELHNAFIDSVKLKFLLAIALFIFIEFLFYFALLKTTSELNRIIDSQLTDLEKRNEDLLMINKTMSHDLKNPLNLISGFTSITMEMIDDEMKDSPEKTEIKSFLTIISDSANEMNLLIEDLLTYANKGLEGLNVKNTSLNYIINHALKQLKFQIDKSKASIKINGGDITVHCASELIKQVFANLISNSIKYCEATVVPQIDINVSEDDKYVFVKVKDNGIGISEDKISSIFDRYTRVHDESFSVEGYGIGLDSVKRILNDHDAEITVESSLGEGSTFTIKFLKMP